MASFFVGMTGASGHAYAERLVRTLVAAGQHVDLAVTGAGVQVLRHELGIEAAPDGRLAPGDLAGWLGDDVAEHVESYGNAEVGAPPSSGTHLSGGVVLCPCSMGTLARVSAGFSSNLVERVADVALKEGRPLVVVPREAPLSEIHLENLLRLARLGAAIVPAAPGFYHRPKSIDDLVGHLVDKIVDRLGVARSGGVRWSGLDAPAGDPGTDPGGGTTS